MVIVFSGEEKEEEDRTGGRVSNKDTTSDDPDAVQGLCLPHDDRVGCC